MNIEEIKTIWPQTNPHWANEVDKWFFADERDLDENGWLDPWGRPLDKSLLSSPVKADTAANKWTERGTVVTLEHPQGIVGIPLAIFKKMD